MTAGHGIIHREFAFLNERAHILQLWVTLPAEKKMVDSRYQDLLADRQPGPFLWRTRTCPSSACGPVTATPPARS